ncbi:aromatic acid exporter family protein [Paenibacillus hodogayensis]|uniref:Aromatic acid exporter family protein n=1 Tax=Paenibacillus hodogayensis TaxID=279208 RepID=A0ABV5W622_9BACL
MLVGLRVIKTVIAIAISISIARLMHLEPSHFAGIISMLAVQPSVYRSLKHTLAHLASALCSVLLGIGAALLFGNYSIVIAGVSLLVMALHVRLRKTASLTLAVIVAVNTIGTSSELHGNAAYHQFMLVIIGMVVGTLVNLIRKPVHREREEVLLMKSESMLRTLLYYIQHDLMCSRMTPYKPQMRMQIEEVRTYIESGKEISGLIREDRWLNNKGALEPGDLFRTYETMLERIRDLVKALQKADLSSGERQRLIRAIGLTVRLQERVMQGRRVHDKLMLKALRPELLQSDGDASPYGLFPYYQAYEALTEYVEEFSGVTQTFLFVSSRSIVDGRQAFFQL